MQVIGLWKAMVPCLGRENALNARSPRNVALPQEVPSTSMSSSRNFADIDRPDRIVLAQIVI